MPYMIILKVRKFHQSAANYFSTVRQKPVGGGGIELSDDFTYVHSPRKIISTAGRVEKAAGCRR